MVGALDHHLDRTGTDRIVKTPGGDGAMTEARKKAYLLSARDARLFTGLALSVFITSHLVNHALGLVSIQAMEAYRKVHSAIWQSPPGVVVLYGSIAVHLFLALYALLSTKPFAAYRRIGRSTFVRADGSGFPDQARCRVSPRAVYLSISTLLIITRFRFSISTMGIFGSKRR